MTNVLFVCTGNSARSILCAATLNHLGEGRFAACSAGSQPTGIVNPNALAELERRGIPCAGERSKSWDEFRVTNGPAFDWVITVCDSAASEACPVLFGDFAKVHWGMPDPASVAGDDAAVQEAFRRTENVILDRLTALVALPVESLDQTSLQQKLVEIGERFPAVALTEQAA